MSTSLWLIGSAAIGVVAAWLSGCVMRGNGFGLVGDIIAAVLGALFVGYALRIAGMDLGGGLWGRLIASFGGALTVLFFVHLFTARRTGHRFSS